MTYVLLGIIAVLLAERLILGLGIRGVRDEFKDEREAMSLERSAWANERRDLNNRIQVPEAAPYMDPGASVPPVQHVPFEDDEAFAKAREEIGVEWPS